MNQPQARIKAVALPVPQAVRAVAWQWPSRLRHLWAEECDHGLMSLLVPLAFSAGIATYFAAPDEPVAAIVVVLAVSLGALAIVKARHFGVFLGAGLLSIYLCGLAVPALKAAMMAPPLSTGPMRMVDVRGFIESVEARNHGTRFIVRQVDGSARLRLTSRRVEALRVGDAVSLKARAGATGGPNYPGGYDFARDAYFQGVSGSGFPLGKIEKIDLGPVPLMLQWRAVVYDTREMISRRIRGHIAGENGLIADALVTGKRDGMTQASNDVLRAAGVFHILSVSGFHMALVTLMVFGVVRGVLALIPAIVLYYPTKKLAAAVALLVATLYLQLSGAEVATQRSWVMIAVVLIGTMAGREALSLRTLGVAVIVVLLVSPESLLSPSFQMSFAATLALVSGLRLARPWLEAMPDRKSRLRRIGTAVTHGVTGLAASSFLAGLATTPYAAYHFQTIQFYGLLGNLLGAPIIEFLTMPLEIVALLLWPLGLDGIIWHLVGLTIDWFMATARFVASLSGGTLTIRAFGMPALLVLTLGLLMIGLMKTRLRLIGLAPLAIGTLMAFVAVPPAGFVDRMGETALVNDTVPVVIGKRANKFATGQWLSALGQSALADRVTNGTCDAFGCSGGQRLRIALSFSPHAMADDCEEAGLIISHMPAPAGCRALVKTVREVRAMGGFALHQQGEKLVITPNDTKGGKRPWQSAASVPPVTVETPLGRSDDD